MGCLRKKFLKLKKNKKGIFQDTIQIGVFILIISLLFFIGKMTYNHIGAGFQLAEVEDNSTNYSAVVGVFEDLDYTWGIMDTSFLVIVIGLTIGLIMSAFLINTKPYFVVVNLIGMVVLMFLAMIKTFIFDTITTNAVINATASGLSNPTTTFTITQTIMNNYPWVALFIVVIASVIMYGKGKASETQ